MGWWGRGSGLALLSAGLAVLGTRLHLYTKALRINNSTQITLLLEVDHQLSVSAPGDSIRPLHWYLSQF